MDEHDREIGELKTRLDSVEKTLDRFRDTQDDIDMRMRCVEKDNNSMAEKLAMIMGMLEKMEKKKMRLVDVLIAVVGVAIAGGSFYASIQSNNIARMVMELSKKIP